jgi:hypothetical protein
MPAAEWFSLAHAAFVVSVGSILFCYEAGWGRDDTTTVVVPITFWTHTTWWQSALFLCSAAYFLIDSVVVSVRSVHTLVRKCFFVTHHVWCVIGLVSPILTGLDGGLVLVGFVIAETANPLRLWVQHWLLSTIPAPGVDDETRRQRAKWVTGFVFVALALSRMVCLYFTLVWVWPLAASHITLVCASVLLACTVSVCLER